MADRYSHRPKQRSWFVPVVVVLGVAGFFLWESGWRPFEVLEVPTGTIDPNGVVAGTETRESLALPDVNPQEFSGSAGSEDLLLDFDPELVAGQSEPDLAAPEPLDTPATIDSSFGGSMASIDAEPPGFDGSEFAPMESSSPAIEAQPVGATRTLPERVTTANAVVTPPTMPSAELQSKLNKIDFLIEENDFLTAHRDLSAIYWYEPESRDFIQKRIQHTSSSIYAAARPHYMKPYVVQPGDTLGKIAEQYKVPWQYLERLNRVSASRVREGSKLKVIRGPFGAVVDLSDFELTIHSHGYYVRHYKIGIGKKGQRTPLGEFRVGEKLENPTYYPPEGGVIAGDDPKNPLGEYWLSIGDGFGIHGTIDPGSIGKAESRGCIRLRDKDIQEVFDMLSVGSPVLIRQ